MTTEPTALAQRAFPVVSDDSTDDCVTLADAEAYVADLRAENARQSALIGTLADDLGAERRQVERLVKALWQIQLKTQTITLSGMGGVGAACNDIARAALAGEPEVGE